MTIWHLLLKIQMLWKQGSFLGGSQVSWELDLRRALRPRAARQQVPWRRGTARPAACGVCFPHRVLEKAQVLIASVGCLIRCDVSSFFTACIILSLWFYATCWVHKRENKMNSLFGFSNCSLNSKMKWCYFYKCLVFVSMFLVFHIFVAPS